MVQSLENTPNPHVPHYPTNEQAGRFVRIMEGQTQRTFYDMREHIHLHVGTPQETQDWSDPDQWISEILTGDEQILASHIWQGTNGLVNPRHLVGVWLLSSQYRLLEPGPDDVLYLTSTGQDFVENPSGATVQHLDYSEGLLNLLLIVSEHGPGKRSNFLAPYSEFMERYSNYRSLRAIKSAWYGRIRNLLERNLVSRSGMIYEITQHGLTYLEHAGTLLQQSGRESVTEPQTEIRRLLKEQQTEVRQRLHESLSGMDPYQVEILIKRLLEAMEYENVEVTSRSGDGGVDVIADIEVGITPVREVVQVKRRRSNIQRRTLDELRGSLHRFEAMRGTIITTGGFSSGAQNAAFERGAAPITLIDGERLVDLLIEHEIGIRKRSVQLIEFEPADFAEVDTEG